MIGQTGIWGDTEAQPQHYPKSAKLAANIASILVTDKSVIDFGCGDCYYMSVLYSMETPFDVLCIDGHIPKERFPVGDNIIHGMDLSYRVDLKSSKSSEAGNVLRGQVISLEVGEHIPAEFEQTFLDNLCRHCNSRMVVSWAVPGQPGLGHVNCQPNDYIKNEIERRGFKFNSNVTNFLRSDIEMHVSYFKSTLMVFDKL